MDNDNIWAPWRIAYLKSLEAEESGQKESEGCFLCNYWKDGENDKKNLVLWRTQRCLVVFNRFPYTGGHLLIAPAEHIADLYGLDNDTMLEMMLLTRDAQKVISAAIKPQGFNIGINISRCAGAGLPGHVHLHLVPRWDGDTNFITTVGHVRVISQALDELYDQLIEISQRLKLPTVK
jgi:ATP adenylyltransferase